MNRGIFSEVLRRPLGLAAVFILGVLYTGALFAPLLAPYEVSDQSLDRYAYPSPRMFKGNEAPGVG